MNYIDITKKNPEFYDTKNKSLTKNEFSKNIQLDQISYGNGNGELDGSVSMFYTSNFGDYRFRNNCWL